MQKHSRSATWEQLRGSNPAAAEAQIFSWSHKPRTSGLVFKVPRQHSSFNCHLDIPGRKKRKKPTWVAFGSRKQKLFPKSLRHRLTHQGPRQWDHMATLSYKESDILLVGRVHNIPHHRLTSIMRLCHGPVGAAELHTVTQAHSSPEIPCICRLVWVCGAKLLTSEAVGRAYILCQCLDVRC